jgi:hypothetical protein
MSDQKIKELKEKVDALLTILGKSIQLNGEGFDLISDNFKSLEEKVDSIDKKIKNFHGATDENFKDVKFELKKLNETHDYQEMFNNLQIVKG